jgi:NAD(P)-dependent dehydrogenase (short-subunit alcohol dehydrogenase family)
MDITEMTNSLHGKYVAITGAFGVLGMAVAHAAREAGATVAAIDQLDKAGVPRSELAHYRWGVHTGKLLLRCWNPCFRHRA